MESKVLIIDDETEVCTILTLFLKQKQCVVDCSYTLNEGLTKVQSFTPDIVFLDHKLPDGDGVSSIGIIKAINPCIRIVVISGADEINEKAIHQGADLFIKKPFRLKQILESLSVNNQ